MVGFEGPIPPYFDCSAGSAPHSQASYRVKIKHSNRRSSDGREAEDEQSRPRKMGLPNVPSRMKECCEGLCLGVKPGQIAGFFEIALRTGEREAIEFIASAVLAGDDVLDLERNQWRIGLPPLTSS